MHEIRPPTAEEMPTVGRLAAGLVRLHHGFDPARFMLHEPLEEGYARFLSGMLKDPKAVVLVAARPGDPPVGYAYARLEPRDWNRLLDAHGKLHDIYVDASCRRSGVARALAEATFARLRALGATRILLDTAAKNEPARAFFESLGFRATLVEMMR